MISHLFLVAFLCCGCLAAPPGVVSRGIFTHMVGGGVDMMSGFADGMMQSMGAGVDTMFKLFGDFSPAKWNPPDSSAILASITTSAAFQPSTKSPEVPVKTSTTTTTATFGPKWIILGRK